MIDYSFTYASLEYFLLIFTRITCFIFIAPFFSMNNTPHRVKIGLGFFTSLLIFYVLRPLEPLGYTTLLGYAVIVLKEALTGLIIGFGANMCSSIVSFAGHVIDMEVGLAMVSLMDPTTRESTSISGVFYQYVVTLMLIVSGMYQYLLKALTDTFTLIPINGAIFRTDSLTSAMIRFMSEYIVIGFRICLPVFAVMIMLNVVLGVLAKVSPQLNMFAVGIQIKILVGLTVMFLTVGMMPIASNFIFEQMKKIIVAFVEGLM
ncbi:flagellar biosynthetic protein FliR [Kineothrix sp. MB12-C1]|uniref:flagellar biosynthetic protein FliR n=1 Tax=Kineothrix sp. MB12-C1 TaxID=3070215 RepID=UPI0027D2E272|nr:flagellar biosynthetic protein FliR [Kineothrix sp. MB12-C1]WMC93001.1 flagellar biosynthetic protein FliR [Kineothrix sp. MB12-C1]